MIVDTIEKKYYGLFYLKQGILLFWGIWFALAFLTNLTDFLVVTNIITSLPFHSGNYKALEKVVNVYNISHHFLNGLFYLDILAQGTCSILFLISAICFFNKKYTWRLINIAFIISISLWAIFVIMEEIFIAYSFEATHIRLIIFEILSLFSLHLLPHY